MIRGWASRDGRLVEVDPASAGECVWIDLHKPGAAERESVATQLGITLPTRDDMVEIEPSDRLYTDDGTIYMTLTTLHAADTERAERAVVTLILKDTRLVTIRHADPKPFRVPLSSPLDPGREPKDGPEIAVRLLELIIDRTADVLEMIGSRLDRLMDEVFKRDGDRRVSGRHERILAEIGRNGDLISKVRESLVSIGRLAAFAMQFDVFKKRKLGEELKSVRRDAVSLTDHASFLSGNIELLLDATLGLISIEQNSIIKIFSVVATVFVPPTLIASIYGMNFDHMPELDWLFGYPMAIIAMIISAVVPVAYFRHKGWL